MAALAERVPARAAAWGIPLLIGVVAFGARLMSALHSGGLDAVFGYDEGVYFAASSSFVSGLLPYRDFLLVHPPGSVVFLAPFALLGKATSEPTGWMAARLGVMLLGATNAVLIYVIARRVSLVAGIVAGGLYALWGPVIHVERTTMLEAFVLAAIVVALWAMNDAETSTWRLILAGAALGLGASTKLWGLVPLLIIVGWLVFARAWRSVAVVTGTAAVAFAVIVLPFFAQSPERMVDDVIRAQIGRGRGGTPEHDRLTQMFGLSFARFDSVHWYALTIGLAALAVVVFAMGIAWAREPRARPWVALLFTQMAVLIAVPVYFEGYSSFIGPALILVCGTAVGVLWRGLGSRRVAVTRFGRAALLAGVVLLASVSAFHAVRTPIDLRPPTLAMARVVTNARCVGSDSAGLLLSANVLARNIGRGCPTVVDFDGTVYSFADGANPRHLDSIRRRLSSRLYQQFMRAYFAANDVVMMHRATADAMDAQTRTALHSRPLLVRRRGLRIYGAPASP